MWREFSGTERREFFRVEGRVRLHYKKICEDPGDGVSQTEAGANGLSQPPCPSSNGGHGSESIEGMSHEEVLKRVLESLEILEQKVEMLRKVLLSRWSAETLELLPCLVNISGSGMRFPTRERFEVGDRLEVTLELPMAPNHLIRLCGEVVHVLEPEPDARSGGHYHTAIKFISVCEADRNKIIRYTIDRQYEQAGSSSLFPH